MSVCCTGLHPNRSLFVCVCGGGGCFINEKVKQVIYIYGFWDLHRGKKFIWKVLANLSAVDRRGCAESH